jgi:hypothetical protein
MMIMRNVNLPDNQPAEAVDSTVFKSLTRDVTAVLAGILMVVSVSAEPVADSASLSLEVAQRIIDDYQSLRRECTLGDYDARRVCVSELSKATPVYRQAKDTIERLGAPSARALTQK